VGATPDDTWQVAKHCLNYYIPVMSTVAEIEKALQTLPVEEARKIAGWLQRYLDETWDKQIEGDIVAGRLDKVWERARADIAAGRVKPLDEIINDE
jgi:hypothetical protein